MFKEYAIEPAAIGASWDNFRHLIALLTIEQGRLISRFPVNWEDEVAAVAKASGLKEVRIHSIVERMILARRQGTIIELDRKYRPEAGGWTANALAEHERSPFYAIVTHAKHAGNEAVVEADEVTDQHPLFVSEHSWEVQRTGAAIANAVIPVVRAAKEILIVDPFLDWRDVPKAIAYRESLSAIINGLYFHRRRNVKVQLHFKTQDSRPPADLIVQNAKRMLKGLLPQSFSLELYEWEEASMGEDFHDRYLLSDSGGLSIGAGFAAVGAHQNAKVTVEPHVLTQRLMKRFTPKDSPFKLVGDVMLISWDGKVDIVSFVEKNV